MKPRLEVRLDTRSLERVEGDLLVAGFFREDRPLRGAAGRADWRMCGLFSRILLDAPSVEQEPESILLSTQGRLRVPRVLLFGLGNAQDFDAQALARVTRQAVTRALGLGSARLVLEPPGLRAEELAPHAGTLLEAVLEPVRAQEGSLHLRLLVSDGEGGRVEAALRNAIMKRAAGEAVLDSPRGQPARRGPEGL